MITRPMMEHYGGGSKFVYNFVCLSIVFTCGVSQTIVRSDKVNNTTSFTGQAYVQPFDNTSYAMAKFLGIAYAQPPVGEKRFAKPMPLDLGSVTYDATRFKSICYQRVQPNDGCQAGFTMDEDCLYLNIYVPMPDIDAQTKASISNKSLPTMSLPEVKNRFPVFIFIHGGAYVDGNGNCYDGSVLSGVGEIIVVTINYRLNVLGFVSTDDDVIPANLGLWDQHQAIKWVSENINIFGGDPSRITVGGQSSGGYSAVFQGLFPGNDNFFHRVISQSGTPTTPKDVFMKSYTTARNLAATLGCNITGSGNKSSEIKSCLMGKNASSLAQAVVPAIVPFSLGLAPTVDGDFITVSPSTIFARSYEHNSAFKKVPDGFRGKDLLIGFTAEDGEVVLRLRAREKFYETNNLAVITETLRSPQSRDAWKQLIFEILAESSDDIVDGVLIDAVLDKYMDWAAPNDLVGLSNRVVKMLTDVVFGIPAVNTALSHALSSHNVTSPAPGVNNSTTTNMTVINGTSTNMTVINGTSTNMTVIIGTSTNGTSPDGIGGTTYVYKFTLPTTNERYINKYISWLSGTEHSDDIPFVFGKVVSNDSVKIAKSVMKYWSNFVKTGNPNLPVVDGPIDTSVYWKEFTATEQSYLEISSPPESKTYVDAQSHHFWYDFLPSLQHRLEPTVKSTTAPATCVVITATSNSGSRLMVYSFIAVSIVIHAL